MVHSCSLHLHLISQVCHADGTFLPCRYIQQIGPVSTGRFILFALDSLVQLYCHQPPLWRASPCCTFPQEAAKEHDSCINNLHTSLKRDVDLTLTDDPVSGLSAFLGVGGRGWGVEVAHCPLLRHFSTACTPQLHLDQCLGTAFAGTLLMADQWCSSSCLAQANPVWPCVLGAFGALQTLLRVPVAHASSRGTACTATRKKDTKRVWLVSWGRLSLACNLSTHPHIRNPVFAS